MGPAVGTRPMAERDRSRSTAPRILTNMATLVREGGFPVLFLLAFGLVAMAFAVRFASAPTQRVFRTTLALSAATLLTSINGIFAAFSAVAHHAPEFVKSHPGDSL